MADKKGCFDPNSIQEDKNGEPYSFLPLPPSLMVNRGTDSHHESIEENIKLSTEELSFQLQQQLAFEASLIHDSLVETPYPPSTPDLLNLFHLPRCSTSSLLPNSSVSFTNPGFNTSLGLVGDLPMADTASSSTVLYDTIFPLNLPPQTPYFRELFHSLPTHALTSPVTASRGGTLFGVLGDDYKECNGGRLYEDADDPQQFEHGVNTTEFAANMSYVGKGQEGGKGTKVSEHQRRKHLTDKFETLRSLVPKPTKNDRASVLRDARDYIKELLGTVEELKLRVEKKRCGSQRIKRIKTEGEANGNVVESLNMNGIGDPDQKHTTSLRSSWLQRKSKDTEVDVRIIEDEVTIKVIQRKKINCLLVVSKVLDELQLDLHHVAGGHIGDHCSFLFNTKIHEDSCIYATAIANKLIEVMDRESASSPPPCSS
ncbi:hypothetical protein K2173_024375 [Erythroxylum novogranatense]|uniref:BHLH domain-containing protein n=1 Tax=Erythroxylum novogranatense TaxID=1862640 RepID=A0AAV8SU76_9ROSI|nr:hypothetical protein K2173_024375 [Erythroxylum novogranatense]